MATPSQWLAGARPKTLPAAVAPVLVGSGAAAALDGFRPVPALLALVVALALQVAVNYANDYSDGRRGTDADRVGPMRLVGSGAASPRQVLVAACLAFAVAGVAGLALAALSSWWLVAVGAVCIAAAWLYTGGPLPYGYRALGEVFVFVFFGLVATAGSAYVQEEQVTMVALAAAVPVGLLASAILVVNNLRDIDSDEAAGKRTLAVRIGDRATRGLYRRLVLGAYALLPVVAGAAQSFGPLVAFVTLPLGLRTLRLSDDALAQAARLELVFALLLAVGLWLPT
jgi:1,4-dihydroxy-2-naphthoate polyprenyltransferase